MSVQDLNQVHRRYIRISNHFKSAWTFHQFVQGLSKVFDEVGPPGYPSDFQNVYAELKEVSQNLSETTAETASQQLDGVEAQMAPLIQGLLASDDQVSPSFLRQFFQRVKNYDDNILSQLVKFYLYSQEGSEWNFQRLDKTDYLITKLAAEFQDNNDAFVLRDLTQLREMVQGFWVALAISPSSEAEVAQLKVQLDVFQEEINSTESVDQLHDRTVVQRFRDFKHSLGNRFFEPRLVPEIVRSNLAIKNHVHHLYRRDEQRIIAEYQQVFELERDVPIDVQLGEELNAFRQAVEQFEKHLEGDNIRLKEIAHLRQKVKDLVPRLKPESDTDIGPIVAPVEARELSEDGVSPALPTRLDDDSEYIAEYYEAIIATLDDTNPTLQPKKVVLQPDVFSLGLGPREVVAYRRLFGGGSCDRVMEEFVLQAAALRARIEVEVDEIKDILDDTAVSGDAPVYQMARQTCARADLYLRRFSHQQELRITEGDAKEARALQRLKMKLMRGYSGLWLMAHR